MALSGQLPLGQVARRELDGRDDGTVGDADAVVDLVALLQTAQDGDALLEAGLVDEHGLEATLQGLVLLDVLAVLVERGGADAVQVAASQGGLQEVRGVRRPLRAARAHDRVQLVDEEDDVAARRLDLLEDRLHALLELAAVLRAGEHRAQVEREEATALQDLGHVAGDDAPGEALGDGGLARRPARR